MAENQDFSPGDLVFISSLRKVGTIKKISKNGTVHLTTDRMEVKVHQSQLKHHSPSKKQTKKSEHAHTRRWKQQIHERKIHSRDRKPVYLDLHGMRPLDAEERISTAIDAALRKNADSMVIIHGHGKGVLKRTVEKLLGSMPAVKAFKADPENSGQILVYF